MESQYIFMLVLGYVTFCYGQDVSVVLPSCAAVLCAEPLCPNPITRNGECCPICLEDCRLVRCGMAPDTACVIPPGRCCPVCQQIEKPGTCPQLRNPLIVGHCAELCSSDQGCPGIQKCCSVGCGRDCMNPINTPRTCSINGEVVENGATVKVDCNTCQCRDGDLICTLIACEKPGTCPSVSGPGICVDLCSSDQNCQGQQKCCSNGCGHVCMDSVPKPRTCNINGEVVDDGATVKVDCNTCTCSDGNVICTEKACIEKPGTCPQLRNPLNFGICAELCSSDQGCPGVQKCCSVGCGRDCMNPINTPRTCNINGEVVDDGATVKVDCNTCTCSDGNVICTEKACIEKPGTCPQLRNPLNFGICAELCSSDQGCPGVQKCCSVGCGRDCMNPISTPRTCNINGEVVDDGATVKVDCNTCTCSDGNVICTEKACIEKPGTCPQLRDPWGHCAELCSSDQGCPGIQKCCSVGCGRDCMNPINTPIVPDCFNVRCPPLSPTCDRQITPAGQCCPICPGNRGYGRRRRYRD